jgi:tetratricopeptide (TPR) repeat protein
MKLLICLIFTLTLTASLQAQTPNEIEANKIEANKELHQASAAYQKGSFAEAQAHSEKALELDPENRDAPYFVARAIHAQYKPGDLTPENIAKARDAIDAYQRILDRVPTDDEAYKAGAYLYSALQEEQLLREWVLHRAGNGSVAEPKRAEAYVVLASKDWDCSFKVTELTANKVTTVDGNKQQVSYRMPKARETFERAKECANRGLEMASMAITLAPENVTAWSYKTNILLELAKLAEMSGDVQQKSELHRQYEEALKETTRLSTRPKSTP